MGGSQAQKGSNRPFSEAVRLTTPHERCLTKNSYNVRDLSPLYKSPAYSLIELGKEKKRLVANLGAENLPLRLPLRLPL
jgi:hypothetical protein